MLGLMHALHEETRPVSMASFRDHFDPAFINVLNVLVHRRLVRNTLDQHLCMGEWVVGRGAVALGLLSAFTTTLLMPTAWPRPGCSQACLGLLAGLVRQRGLPLQPANGAAAPAANELAVHLPVLAHRHPRRQTATHLVGHAATEQMART